MSKKKNNGDFKIDPNLIITLVVIAYIMSNMPTGGGGDGGGGNWWYWITTTTVSPDGTTVTTTVGPGATTTVAGSWKCCVQGRNSYTCRESCLFLLETQVGLITYTSQAACQSSCPFGGVTTTSTVGTTTSAGSSTTTTETCAQHCSSQAWAYSYSTPSSASDCHYYDADYCQSIGYNDGSYWYGSVSGKYCCCFACGAIITTTIGPSMNGPADCSNWASSLGHSHWFYDVVHSLSGCEQYASDWCTANGEPGSNWLSSFGYSDDCCIWSCHGEVQ